MKPSLTALNAKKATVKPSLTALSTKKATATIACNSRGPWSIIPTQMDVARVQSPIWIMKADVMSTRTHKHVMEPGPTRANAMLVWTV